MTWFDSFLDWTRLSGLARICENETKDFVEQDNQTQPSCQGQKKYDTTQIKPSRCAGRNELKRTSPTVKQFVTFHLKGRPRCSCPCRYCRCQAPGTSDPCSTLLELRDSTSGKEVLHWISCEDQHAPQRWTWGWCWHPGLFPQISPLQKKSPCLKPGGFLLVFIVFSWIWNGKLI